MPFFGMRAIDLVGLTVVACAVRAVCGGGGHPVVAFLYTPRAAPGGGAFAACPLRRMRTGLMNLQMSLEDEISSVRSMKVAEIKRELSQRGLVTDDMFEKEEFVRRLAQARLDKVPRRTAGRVEYRMRVAHAHSITFTRAARIPALHSRGVETRGQTAIALARALDPTRKQTLALGRERRRRSEQRSKQCVCRRSNLSLRVRA